MSVSVRAKRSPRSLFWNTDFNMKAIATLYNDAYVLHVGLLS